MRAALVLALWLVAAGGAAQSEAELARAKASFKAGAAAYGAADYAAAIQALEAAYAITPLPAIAFSLAQAERRQFFATHEQSHLERAIALFTRYVEQVESGGRRADALEALAQLEPLAVGAHAAPSIRRSEAVRTRLMITAEAPGAQLSIDDEAPDASPLIREVTPGRHRVTAAGPGFFPAEREVTAVEGELILIELSLHERPGILALTIPAEAKVYVDGRLVHRGHPEARLELPSGPHDLVVAQAGRRSFSESVSLTRGAITELRITLALTRQRKAARGLFAVGGAALVSGIVLGGLALRREHQAEDFLRTHATSNVDADALAAYADDVRARDRLRTASIVATSTAAASLLTAVLLRELDRPDADTTERRPVARALRLTPAIGVGSVAVTLTR